MGLIVKPAQPPADPARRGPAQTNAGVEVDPKRLLIALSIFAVLLAVAILIDALDWVDDPAPYVGLASTALGAVLGFVTGEVSGSSGG